MNTVDLELFNYLGSKKRQVDSIMSEIPKTAKTIFDPMCGSSAVLYECKKRGMHIIANDISPMAYYYSKAILGQTKFSKEDAEKLLSARPVKGYLYHAKTIAGRPKSRILRQVIDGICTYAHQLPPGKKEFALGAMADCLSSLFGSFGFFRKAPEEQGLYTVSKFKKKLLRSIISLNSKVIPQGSAAVTRKDAFTIPIPKVDIIYFDPPYDISGTSEVPYAKHYALLNSILMQREVNLPPFPRERIPELIKRFANKCKILLVSSSSQPNLKYRQILKEHFGNTRLKRITFKSSGGIPQGAAVPMRIQTDYLWIAENKSEKLAERQGLRLPGSHAKWIWTDRQTAIVLPESYRHLADKSMYLVDSSHCYGVIHLKEPFSITKDELIDRFNEHLLSPLECEELFGNAKKFLYFPFVWVEKFPERRPISQEGKDLIADRIEFLAEEYGKPQHSGEEQGSPIHLKEVVDSLKTFKIKRPYICLVGGLATWGRTKNDIDILIRKKKPKDENEDIPLKFRIIRQLPKHKQPARNFKGRAHKAS